MKRDIWDIRLAAVVLVLALASIGCGVTLPPCLVAGTCLPTPPMPSPKPVPVPKACPQITDNDAAPVDQTQQYGPDYASGILALQRNHPDWFTFGPNGWQAPQAGDHAVYPTAPAVTAFRERFYLELGQEFGKSGLCFQTIGDELHVFNAAVTPIVSERYKPFEQGGGREIQKPYQGRTLAVVLGAPATPPPATPPPTAPTPAPPVAPPPPLKDAPPPSKLVFDAGIPRVKPADPTKVFWTITPKVCDVTYCAGAQCCPYGVEGDPNRSALEKLHAWPVWFGADPRDDSPFTADSARGVHVKVCVRDIPTLCIEADAP